MKKKLLFCIQTLDIGGPQKSLLSLLYALDYNSYDVSLIIWSGGGTLKEYVPEQVEIISLPKELSYLRVSKEKILKDSFSLLINGNASLVFKVISLVLKNKGDMIVARQRFWKANHHIFKKLDREFDVAIAVSGGNLCYFIADCINAKKKYTWIRTDYRVLRRDYAIDKLYFDKMNGILTVSNECREIMAHEFPDLNDKLYVFNNLLPFDLYKRMKPEDLSITKAHNQVILVTIARIDKNKGFDLAVAAASILKKAKIDFRWLFVGDGEYKKELTRIIRVAGLQDEIIFTGFVNNTYSIIEKADIFVHPSKFEGKSNSVEEAKYACKPIVVTNYPTVKDQIEHMVNGYIVEYNAEELAKGIINLIDHKDICQQFQNNLERQKNINTPSADQLYKIIVD